SPHQRTNESSTPYSPPAGWRSSTPPTDTTSTPCNDCSPMTSTSTSCTSSRTCSPGYALGSRDTPNRTRPHHTADRQTEQAESTDEQHRTGPHRANGVHGGHG